MKRPFSAIAIGTSWGGLHALRTVLAPLPAPYPHPIFIVQHRKEQDKNLLASLLQEITPVPVQEANNWEPIQTNTIYLAPPDYHLQIEPDKQLTLAMDEAIHYSRPAIDVLFTTAANVYKTNLLGILLTGASQDGTAGLRRIKLCGGQTIVQDPQEAEAALMPQTAVSANLADQILTLAEIANYLRQY